MDPDPGAEGGLGVAGLDLDLGGPEGGTGAALALGVVLPTRDVRGPTQPSRLEACPWTGGGDLI